MIDLCATCKYSFGDDECEGDETYDDFGYTTSCPNHEELSIEEQYRKDTM
jgi:hypothetical protein